MVSIRTSAGVTIALLAAALPASAHIGASVAKAAYTHPIPPVGNPLDGSSRFDFSSYVPEEADTVYHIDWIDGDVDPTGRFYFYYLDHLVSDSYSAADVEKYAMPVIDTKGRKAASIWTSCTCALDAGVTCPDIGDAGMRWCDNFVDWDTSQIPDGTYWLMAVNNDPPFYVYNPSMAPVRIHHGTKKPPVVLVEYPDGLGFADQSYLIEVIAIGTGTMKLDLAWGDNSDMNSVLAPVHNIATGLPVTIGPDGMTGYQWDTSGLEVFPHFVRATLTDDNGQVYSDDRFPQAIFHTPDGGSPVVDLSAASAEDGPVLKLPPAPMGCSCAVGGAARGGTLFALLALLLGIGAIRRAARPCSRSGCTAPGTRGSRSR